MRYEFELSDGTTVCVESVQADYWTGYIGGTSGQFAYGMQDDCNVIVSRNEMGFLTINEIEVAQ